MNKTYDITLKYNTEFLREMGKEALNELLNHAQRRFFELRTQCSPHGRVKHVPKPHLWGKVKKDIARIKTILGESNGKEETQKEGN